VQPHALLNELRAGGLDHLVHFDCPYGPFLNGRGIL
jgi:hypothetical protein